MPTVGPGRYMVNVTWDEVPHLGEDVKREMLASIPPHLRDARSKGTPSLASGAIYPVPLSDITVDPFPVPEYWKRAYGLDVGWRMTAAVWGAQNPQDKVIYLYTEHYRSNAEPSQHAAAIRARGEWINGTIDKASRGRSANDGEQLIHLYRENGLRLVPSPDRSVEAGIVRVWQLLESGQVKVFSTMGNLLGEYRHYRRDETGNIVKKNDHAMDAMRYLILMFDEIATPAPIERNGLIRPMIGDRKAGM